MAMKTKDPLTKQPSIGFIEASSIARGIEATDAMMKMAEVELLMTAIIPRGKYLIMIAGILADVEQSMKAGLEVVGNSLLDHFTIPNVHEQLPAAIKGKIKVPDIEAIGVIETKEVASAIFAADAAVKAAGVTLIEARNQSGGKGLVTLTGEVGAVRSAVNAGVATVKKDGMLVYSIVIPYAHKALLNSVAR